MRLIDADAFKNYIRSALKDTRHLFKDNGKWAEEVTEEFCKDIDEQPTIERTERKTGHWIISDDRNWKTCSECGADVDVSMGLGIFVDNDEVSEMCFCPNCGADMRGEIDG